MIPAGIELFAANAPPFGPAWFQRFDVRLRKVTSQHEVVKLER